LVLMFIDLLLDREPNVWNNFLLEWLFLNSR
jgi:hypothetical protein